MLLCQEQDLTSVPDTGVCGRWDPALSEYRDAAQSDEMMLCQEQEHTSVPDIVWCVWQVGSCLRGVQGCCTR